MAGAASRHLCTVQWREVLSVQTRYAPGRNMSHVPGLLENAHLSLPARPALSRRSGRVVAGALEPPRPAPAARNRAKKQPAAATPLAAPSAEDAVDSLNSKFGSKSLTFASAAGVRTAEITVPDGSSCRVIIDGARVSSYRASQWHGAQEEVLYCVANDEEGDIEQWDLLNGGIVLSFPAFGGLQVGRERLSLGEVAAKATWQVAKAKSKRNETTLTLSSEGNHEAAGESSFWKLEYDVTLSLSGLKTALRVTNLGLRPMQVAPSLVAHVSVADVEGCFLIGCKGHKYLADETDPEGQPSLGEVVGWWWKGLVGSPATGGSAEKPDTHTLVGHQRESALLEGTAGRTPVEEQLLWRAMAGGAAESSGGGAETGAGGLLRVMEEPREYSDLHDGTHRLYPSGPQEVTFVDRGARRSFLMESQGLTDLLVQNPGSDSALEDWSLFACVGFGLGRKTVTLQPQATWTFSLRIGNLGAP